MKKITLLLLTILLTSVSWRSTAQYFTEGFESTFPTTGWTHTQVNAAESWNHSTVSFHSGAQSLQCDYDAALGAQNEVLMSPVINLSSATNPRLKFWFLMSYYWGVDPNNNYDLKVEATTNGGATSTVLWTEAAQGTFLNWTWYQVELNLAAYAGNANFQLILRYQGTDGAQGNFDDILIEETPTCIPPTALTASSVTTTSASLGWTPDASGSAWNIEWGMAPLTQGAGTVVNGVTNPYTLSGLSPGVSYSYYVQTVCGTGTSVWTGPYTFTTLCTASNVPYSLSFDEVTTPALPVCTENVNEGTGNNWATATTPTTPTGFTGNVLRYAYNSTNPANTWFFTNGLNLTAGTSYTLSYKYANNSTFFTPEKLKVAYGTAKNGAAMTNVLADYPNITDATIHSETDIFTPTTTGVYYIGFQAYSDADIFYIYVDDIEVYVTPACPSPTTLAVPYYDAASATFSWNNGNAETAWEIIYGPAGFDPATAGTVVSVTSNPYLLEGLSYGVQYDAYVRAVCSATLSSDWSNVVTWRYIDVPQCASNPTPADDATGVPVGSVTFAWDAPTTGEAPTSYNMYYGLTETTVTTLVGNFTTNSALINLSGYSTTFYWMIVPVNAAGEAQGCAVWSFTTQDPPPPPVCTVTESFNDGMLPAGWTNVANSGTCTWQFGSGTMPTGPNFTDFAAIFDDDACGGGETNNNATLTSAVYDLTGATTAQLSFEVAMQDYATAGDLTVEVYNGTAWQQIAFYTNDLATIDVVTFDVLPYANAAFQVRFTFDDSDDWGWGAGIDDFCLNTDAPALGTSVETIYGFQMYPNPVENTLNLRALNNIDQVKIYNMLGQEVLFKAPVATETQLDMSNLPTGSYIVRVQSGNQVGSYNLIKN